MLHNLIIMLFKHFIFNSQRKIPLTHNKSQYFYHVSIYECIKAHISLIIAGPGMFMFPRLGVLSNLNGLIDITCINKHATNPDVLCLPFSSLIYIQFRICLEFQVKDGSALTMVDFIIR